MPTGSQEMEQALEPHSAGGAQFNSAVCWDGVHKRQPQFRISLVYKRKTSPVAFCAFVPNRSCWSQVWPRSATQGPSTTQFNTARQPPLASTAHTHTTSRTASSSLSQASWRLWSAFLQRRDRRSRFRSSREG